MTRHDPREPLDADERALAGRLSRLGADGPSPALDAKILAAARAAAAPPRPAARRRRRWLAWASLPPAAITGIGVAAACVLALGVVWQMRPRVSMVQTAAAPEEEVFIVADVAPARAPVANPPPFEEAAADAADEAAAPASPELAREGAAPRSEPEPALAAAGAAPEPRADAAPAPAAAPPVVEALAQAAEANAAAAKEEAAADGLLAQRQAAQAEAEADAAAKVRRPTYTTTARATADTTRRRQAFAPPPSPAANAQETTTFPADLQKPEDNRVGRGEVNGNRMGQFDPKSLAGLAPDEDSKLEREDWLLRIRARRDAGDLAGARESLRLFRKEYPRVHLPEDLRKLAADAAP